MLFCKWSTPPERVYPLIFGCRPSHFREMGPAISACDRQFGSGRGPLTWEVCPPIWEWDQQFLECLLDGGLDSASGRHPNMCPNKFLLCVYSVRASLFARTDCRAPSRGHCLGSVEAHSPKFSGTTHGFLGTGPRRISARCAASTVRETSRQLRLSKVLKVRFEFRSDSPNQMLSSPKRRNTASTRQWHASVASCAAFAHDPPAVAVREVETS